MSSTARFHADQLHLHIRRKSQQLRTRTTLAHYHLPTLIQTHQMKYGLTQINAQREDFHEMPPCPALYNFHRAAADHPINWPALRTTPPAPSAFQVNEPGHLLIHSTFKGQVLSDRLEVQPCFSRIVSDNVSPCYSCSP